MATEVVTTNGPVQTTDETVLTLSEAAAFLRVSEDGLKQDADAGQLPGRMVGGEWRFVKHALVEWLSSATPARPERNGPSDWTHEDVVRKAMPRGGRPWILDFPIPDETPEEQEAFLARIRKNREAWDEGGADDAGGRPQ